MNKCFLTYKRGKYYYFKPFKSREDVISFLYDDIKIINYKEIKYINIIKYFVYIMLIKIFERIKGVDFSQYVIYNNDKYNAYEMTDIYSLYKLLNKFKGDYSGSIIDIGCGKGLPFIVFDNFFENKFGVDFNKNLCDIAKKNLKKLNINVHINNKDINDYNRQIDNSYIFMFNPFYAETMENFILKIKNHNNIIIYHNPVSKDILVKNGFIEYKSIRDILGFEIAIFKEVNI